MAHSPKPVLLDRFQTAFCCEKQKIIKDFCHTSGQNKLVVSRPTNHDKAKVLLSLQVIYGILKCFYFGWIIPHNSRWNYS